MRYLTPEENKIDECACFACFRPDTDLCTNSLFAVIRKECILLVSITVDSHENAFAITSVALMSVHTFFHGFAR